MKSMITIPEHQYTQLRTVAVLWIIVGVLANVTIYVVDTQTVITPLFRIGEWWTAVMMIVAVAFTFFHIFSTAGPTR